jgi:hypothetical protein
MGYEAYQIQRASDGKTLKNDGGDLNRLPGNLTAASSWGLVTNNTMGDFYCLPVDYTRNFKQDYSAISAVIDQLPQNGEIYRLNPIFVNG